MKRNLRYKMVQFLSTSNNQFIQITSIEQNSFAFKVNSSFIIQLIIQII